MGDDNLFDLAMVVVGGLEWVYGISALPQCGRRDKANITEPITTETFLRDACRALVGVKTVSQLIDYHRRVPELCGMQTLGDLIAEGRLDGLPVPLRPVVPFLDGAKLGLININNEDGFLRNHPGRTFRGEDANERCDLSCNRNTIHTGISARPVNGKENLCPSTTTDTDLPNQLVDRDSERHIGEKTVKPLGSERTRVGCGHRLYQ